MSTTFFDNIYSIFVSKGTNMLMNPLTSSVDANLINLYFQDFPVLHILILGKYDCLPCY